ncbi:MAG: ABC transporter permease subunit [Verrucomicrobia bacterium]|nr:ABC transporter permease subunit [Verrucomicrobiota bacterium]MBI3870340.1 ABC transporter permease subunit [Verrucomicrobiota bacterium]
MVAWTVVEREMRVAARLPWAWRGRVLPALFAVLALAGLVFFFPEFTGPQQLGEWLFRMLSALMFVVAGLGGFVATSDCLSREHREGTMGLLFLTELGPVDVLAGKLVASSFRIFLGLLAIVPVLAISLLGGGVTLWDLCAVALAALNLLYFSLAAGMLASSCYREANKAFSTGLLIVMIMVCGLPVFGGLIQDFWRLDQLWEASLLGCPGYPCFLALKGSGSNGWSEGFLASLVVVHGMSWGLLGLSCLRLVRSLRVPEKPRGWRWGLFDPWKGGKSYREKARRELLGENAYLWRCALPVRKPWTVWLVLGFIWVIYGFGCWYRPAYFANPASLLFIIVLATLTIKLWVAMEAPHAIASDRQSGALELLSVTPLQGAELVAGQIAALKRQFRAPIVVSYVAGLILAIFWFLHRHYWPGTEPVVILAWIVVAIADVVTIAYFSIAQATVSATENGIVAKSILFILIVPWLLYAFCSLVGSVIVFSLLRNVYGSFWWSEAMSLGGWVVVCLAWDAVVLAWARQRLHLPIRDYAQISAGAPAKPRP